MCVGGGALAYGAVCHLHHNCFVNKIKITERRIFTGDFGWFTNRNRKRGPMRYLLESSGAAQKSLKNWNLNYSRDSLPNHRNQFTKEQFKHFD